MKVNDWKVEKYKGNMWESEVSVQSKVSTNESKNKREKYERMRKEKNKISDS